MRYRNSGHETRLWPNLVDADTGRTLQLGPGETADVDGPVDDPHLTPVKDPKPPKDPAPSPVDKTLPDDVKDK